MMTETVFQFMLYLLTSHPLLVALPASMLITAAFKVAKLRGLNLANYQESIKESIEDTISQNILDEFLRPWFRQQEIFIPQGPSAHDIVLRLLGESEDKMAFAAQIYTNLSQQGMNSPFYSEALQIVSILYGSGKLIIMGSGILFSFVIDYRLLHQNTFLTGIHSTFSTETGLTKRA